MRILGDVAGAVGAAILAPYFRPAEFTSEDVEISTGPAPFKTLKVLEGYTPARKPRGASVSTA